MIKYFLVMVILFLTGCATKEEVVYMNISSKPHHIKQKTYSQRVTQKKYKVRGKWYYPHSTYIGYTETGISSWYGPNFHGKLTSNGETYNMYDYTCANKTLPMNTILKVTNLENGKSVIVRVNDRGPFVDNRITDLSYAAGKKIGLDKSGIAKVKIEVIGLNGDVLKKVTKQNIKRVQKSGNLRYNIQIGAFKNRSGAEIFKTEYKKLHQTKIVKKDGVYKVYLTGFRTKNEAYNFKTKHNLNGFIIKD